MIFDTVAIQSLDSLRKGELDLASLEYFAHEVHGVDLLAVDQVSQLHISFTLPLPSHYLFLPYYVFFLLSEGHLVVEVHLTALGQH